jgi:hypothetical protein
MSTIGGIFATHEQAEEAARSIRERLGVPRAHLHLGWLGAAGRAERGWPLLAIDVEETDFDDAYRILETAGGRVVAVGPDPDGDVA